MLQHAEILVRQLLGVFRAADVVLAQQLADLVLQLADGQAALDRQVAQLFLQLRVLDSEDDLGVTDAQKTDLEVVLYLGGKLEQAELIGHGSAFLTDA
jgi:hypothetical protein